MKRRLQVFISSTFTDLLPERQAAVSAILKAGHIPAGMELFTSADRSQMATIKQWIDESDVYMLILGGRYGSVEPSSGISYTELEYDYAIQQGKPFFAVVITDDCLEAKIRSNGSTFMEKENPKELGLFRQKVLGSISSFFDDPKDIKLCVHETLADFAANRSLKGWVRADEVVDTKPLFEEISKLSEENRQLKESMLELEKRTFSQSTKQAETFAELREVLGAIDIKIPAKLADGTETTVDLLSIFYSNKDTLISGVTNRIGGSDSESFFFFNVCPKLQVHGLAVSEKVAGVRYRRYTITPLGSAFLADIEKRHLLKKKKSDPPVVQNDTPQAKNGETKAPAKRPPRSAKAKL
ncbi:DUF4062 domain-containing protein [Bordetella muralis]|jgi:hypothetical protein